MRTTNSDIHDSTAGKKSAKQGISIHSKKMKHKGVDKFFVKGRVWKF